MEKLREELVDSTVEEKRLRENRLREKYWYKWGPYLSERSWATVREDYSYNGDAWSHFPFEHANARVFRWGEDGLFGVSDNKQIVCTNVALWNGRDERLKERLFGLTGPQGNHGEDVKELYYYLDNTPTHSYMKALYKYPFKKLSLMSNWSRKTPIGVIRIKSLRSMRSMACSRRKRQVIGLISMCFTRWLRAMKTQMT